MASTFSLINISEASPDLISGLQSDHDTYGKNQNNCYNNLLKFQFKTINDGTLLTTIGWNPSNLSCSIFCLKYPTYSVLSFQNIRFGAAMNAIISKLLAESPTMQSLDITSPV